MPAQLLVGVAALVGIGALLLFGRRVVSAWLRYRGTRVVVCPENREMVAVSVDAGHAAVTAGPGRPHLRLESCSRWPEKSHCGQECLGQIESAPDVCLLRNILGDWYRDKTCAFCAKPFETLAWHEHKPGLLSPAGEILDWDAFRPEQIVDVLGTHKAVCWNCVGVERFRRAHPELVTERAGRPSPPPSMA